MVLTVSSAKNSLNYFQANPGRIPDSKLQTSICFVEKQTNTPSRTTLRRTSYNVKQRTSWFRAYGLFGISVMEVTATVPVPVLDLHSKAKD